MKIVVLFVCLLFLLNDISAQSWDEYLKKRAVKIDSLENLGDSVYGRLKSFRLIMVGEMHGTNEPAEFVTGLAKLITKKEDSVLIGIEAPADLIGNFIENSTEINLKESVFFKTGYNDGRSSEAWLHLISTVSKIPNARLFFFDDSKYYTLNRDSLMYINIKNQMKAHPKWKVITLTGNIHNKLIPYNEKITTGTYLVSDKDLNLSKRICSINHMFQKGTMMNNRGKGLELSEVDNGESVFSQFKFENYLVVDGSEKNFSSFLYTRNVTASKMTTITQSSPK